jgi:putative flippase GtrA
VNQAAPPPDAPEGAHEAEHETRTPRRSRALHVQFLLFALVGVGNAAVDASVFTLLVAGLGWRHGLEPLAASLLGFVCGSLHSYAWNSRVTFRSGRVTDSAAVMGQFFSVAAGGALVSALAFSAVRAVWPDEATTLAAAKLGAIGIGMIWNFSLMRGWVFSHRRLALAAERELARGHPTDPA